MNMASIIKRQVGQRIARLDADTPWAKAMLAKLRRGVGKDPGEIPEILELISITEDCASDYHISPAERALYTTLTLYALHRQGKKESMHAKGKAEEGKPAYGDSGDSFGRAVGRLLKSNNEVAVKRRFDTVITSQDVAELSYHARGLVQLVRAAEAPIKFDYEAFAADLYNYCWPDSRNSVRLRWGRDFYRHFNKNEYDTQEKGV